MASDEKHTPGEWVIRDHTVGHPPRRAWIEINAPTGVGRMERPICRIPSGFTNQDADARLIAAAPDLLAACEMLDRIDCQLGDLIRAEDYGKFHAALDRARDALEKIRGGTHGDSQ